MKTLENRRRAPTLLLAAAAALTLLTNERGAAGQTPAETPAASWTQISVLVKNTVAAVKRDLEEMAEEFPPLGALAREAKTDEDSLSYMKNGVRVTVEFRHPLARAEADAPDTSWRVYRLKDGKLLGARSHVSAPVYGRGSSFERRVDAVIRAAEAKLLDHGARTRAAARATSGPSRSRAGLRRAGATAPRSATTRNSTSGGRRCRCACRTTTSAALSG